MATPSETAPVRDVAELARHFAAGEKPAAEHRLGVEHEKIAVRADLTAPPYDGGIGALLSRLRDEPRYRWSGVEEAGSLIALSREEQYGRASVTLEPGGQFEHSDAPRNSGAAMVLMVSSASPMLSMVMSP